MWMLLSLVFVLLKCIDPSFSNIGCVLDCANGPELREEFSQYKL